MKRRAIFVAVAIAAFSATLAISHAVNSQNWVGYANVQVPPAGQFTMVGVNFEAVGGGGVPLDELISTNSLTANPVPTLADRVYVYDPVEVSYDQYYFNNGSFFDVDDNPTNPIVYSGSAFWVQSSLTSSVTNEVYLLGQVPLNQTNETSILSGFQQISSPYPVDFNINSNENWIASGATGNVVPTLADRIFILNGSSYDQYYLKPDGNWYNMDDEVADVSLPVGQGAWYDAKNGFTNVLTRPFEVQ